MTLFVCMGMMFSLLVKVLATFYLKKFILVDPMQRNIVGVPSGGWVSIRFLADNPGR